MRTLAHSRDLSLGTRAELCDERGASRGARPLPLSPWPRARPGPPAPRPHLQLPVLGGVMQRGPAPQVGDLAAVQQEPAGTLAWPRLAAKCMAVAPSLSFSDRLRRCGSPGREGAGQGRGLGQPYPRPVPYKAPPPRAPPRRVPELTSHTMTEMWPICASRRAAGHAHLGRSRCGSASHLHQSTASPLGGPPGTPGTGACSTVLGLEAFTPLRKTQHPPWALSAHPLQSLLRPLTAPREPWRVTGEDLVAGPGPRLPLDTVLCQPGSGGPLACSPPAHVTSFLQCTSSD